MREEVRKVVACVSREGGRGNHLLRAHAASRSAAGVASSASPGERASLVRRRALPRTPGARGRPGPGTWLCAPPVTPLAPPLLPPAALYEAPQPPARPPARHTHTLILAVSSGWPGGCPCVSVLYASFTLQSLW